MSRRKQSNPKPIKRQSDSEDGDDEMEDKLTSNEEEDSVDGPSSGRYTCLNQESEESKEGHISEDRKYLSPSQGNASREFKSDYVKQGRQNSISPSEIEFLKSINFPNDVLFLKKVDVEEARDIGRAYLVCTAIPLQKGSSIGPFLGERVSLSSIRQGDLVLQAKSEDGDVNFIRVQERSGAWLSLLRPATTIASRNATVFFEGGRIWCQVIKDLEVGIELTASFSILQDKNDTDDETSTKSKEMNDDVPARSNSPPSTSLEKSEKHHASTSLSAKANNHAALLFGCPFCGVRFSSARTLDGHLMYYCSKKPSDFPSSNTSTQSTRSDESTDYEKEKTTERKRKSPSVPQSPREAIKSDPSPSPSPDTSGGQDSPPVKCPKTGDTYKCPYCSYTADKISSLNRHMRIHNRGGKSSNDYMTLPTGVPKFETYCKDCNIQFSSVGTYKCHKEYYCSRRSLHRDDVSENGSENSTSPSPKQKFVFPNGKMSFFDAASEHITKLNLQNFMNMESSSMIPGQTRVILAPPIVADGVSNLSFGMPTVIVQPVMPPISTATETSSHRSDVSRRETNTPTEQPLDLTTPKRQLSVDETNNQNSDQTPPKIKQEPTSPHLSPSVKSPTSEVSESPKPQQSREMTPNSHTPKAAVSPAIAPPILPLQLPFFSGKPQLPSSVSKCIDCNIVFYKHENFLIHKKHYCSSRRTRTTSPSNSSEDSNGTSSSFNVTSSHSESKRERSHSSDTDHSDRMSNMSNSPVRTLKSEYRIKTPENAKPLPAIINEEYIYRFYCIPCKIKFSSSSTLKAHKEFYCPHGKESDQSIMTKRPLEEHGSSTLGEENGNFKCDRCESSFISARLLKLHFCTGSSNTVPLVRCTYCDFVTQSEIRLSDHLKVHMPSKAYRCTLCGYRGNTVRGMRMHGKMHVDNGEDFTDENMIEIEEPPLLPVKIGNLSENGPIDMEAELIRLKNEPYKRRRSRKSFEKSENMTHSSERTFGNACVLCGQTFSDFATFAMHIRIHEMVALQAASARTLKCQHCDDVSDNFDNLMKHIQSKHADKLFSEHNGQDADSKSQRSSRTNSRSSVLTNSRPNSANLSSPRSVDESKDTSSIKVESSKESDMEKENSLSSPKTSNVVSIKQEPKSFSDEENEICDKIRPSSCDNRSDDKDNSSSTHSDKNGIVIDIGKGVRNSKEDSLSRSPNEELLTTNIKSESISTNEVYSRPLSIPMLDPTHIMPYYQLISGVGALPMVTSPTHPGDANSPNASEKNGQKYCRNCDISFTYLSTFLAHKKYYCTARPTEEMNSPTQA